MGNKCSFIVQTPRVSQPTAATPRRKTLRTVKKSLMSKAGLTMVQRSLRSSTLKGTSKVRGASAPLAAAAVGSASASP